jgi:hypothetical protein
MRPQSRIGAAVVALAAVLAISPAALAELAGQYVIRGKNPSGQAYKGQAVVKPARGVYHVVWKIGNSRHVGTGILKDDLFSVVYKAAGNKARPGLVVYEVRDDGSLIGVWVGLGQREMGNERWTPAEQTK